MKRKILFLLALLLAIVTQGAWAESVIITTTSDSPGASEKTFTSGVVTIKVDYDVDTDGAYINDAHAMTITATDKNITSVVLRIGFFADCAEEVLASSGTRSISGDGNKKSTWVTFSDVSASSVTITTTDSWVEIDEVTVNYTSIVPVSGVTLSQSEAVLTVGETQTLTATVVPANAMNKSVTWTTSNPSVATVANGVVTAVAAGTATITATTTDGAKTASCTVAVDDPAEMATYVGKIIAADGKMYKTLAAANKYSTASGIVAYYGSTVETGQAYKGIAISLSNSDVTNMYCGKNGSTCSGHTYSNIATAITIKDGIATTAATLETNVAHGYSHQLYYAAIGTTPSQRPAGASAWSIPSIGQWNMIMRGLTGSNGNLSATSNEAFSLSNVNAKIPTGVDGFKEIKYWSCTERDNTNMWMMQFNGSGGLAGYTNKTNYGTDTWCLRTMFAFTSATSAYVVNYDANGGSGAPNEQLKDGGSSLTLSSTVPTREGYTFAGWNTAADGSGTAYEAGAEYTTEDDATLYAQWNSLAMVDCVGKIIAADGKMYKTLAAANKYSTASGVVAYYGSAVETGQPYRAIAISLSNLRYNPDFMLYCGQGESCSGSTYGDFATAITTKNGIATTATVNANNSAHSLSHQVTAAASGNASPRPEGASAWSVPSLGQWNLIVKGLTDNGSDLSTSANAAFSTSNINAKIPMGADAFTETLYWSCTEKDNANMWVMQFNSSGGWVSSSAKQYWEYSLCRAMFAFTSATPVYVVSYDANGGSGAPDEQVKDGGSSLTLSSTVPTREGYTFAGWATTADGDVAYAAGGSYTTDDDVTLYAQWTENTATLAENVNNATWISGHEGDMYDITLTRTLQTGGWNTFCAPFSTATPSGWTVKELTGSAFNSTTGELTLTFDAASSIEAGKPYLVKVDANVANPTFNGVTISNTTTTTETTAADFVPVVNPTNLTGGDKTVLFVTGGNKLTYPSGDGNINGFRAYFKLKDEVASLARAFRMSFDDNVMGIVTVLSDEPATASGIYTIDGRRIEGEPTQRSAEGRLFPQGLKKGVYIVNGKKTIIK